MTGYAIALRAAARADRWFYLVWVLALASTFPAVTSQYRSIISDDAAGRAAAEALGANPTMRALLGPPVDLLDVGSFAMFRVGTFVLAMAGVMAVLGVIRVTRADEEAGRLDLLRSGAVGRHASLAAAVTVGLLAACAFGALAAAAVWAAEPDPAGTAVLGAGLALGTAVWVGVGAVAAQVSASARTARQYGLGVLGAAYLVRALADGSPADSPARALRWLSPVEWPALAQPYAGNRAAVLLLPLALTIVLVGLAVALESRRDLGSGLRPERPGPARAPATLSGATGLAWRLQRGNQVVWAVGLLLLGGVVGMLSSTYDAALKDDTAVADRIRAMGGGVADLKDAFYVAMLGIIVTLVLAFALQCLGRLRREEEDGHAEVMLATATRRSAFAWSHLLPALVVPSAVMAGSALLCALPQGVAEGGEIIAQVLAGGLALLPGVWLVVGLGMTVLGWSPRLGFLPWLVVAWSMVVNWLGSFLHLPGALLDATPFARLPKLPGESMSWSAVIVETLLAMVLVAVGMVGYLRRDIAGR